MDDSRRPLDRDDYERTYAVLHALQMKALEGDVRPFWEILHELHEDKIQSRRVSSEEVIGDEPAAMEVTFALIVLEMLMQGREIRTDVNLGGPVLHQCSVEGCHELTATSRCLTHELAGDNP